MGIAFFYSYTSLNHSYNMVRNLNIENFLTLLYKLFKMSTLITFDSFTLHDLGSVKS